MTCPLCPQWMLGAEEIRASGSEGIFFLLGVVGGQSMEQSDWNAIGVLAGCEVRV